MTQTNKYAPNAYGYTVNRGNRWRCLPIEDIEDDILHHQVWTLLVYSESKKEEEEDDANIDFLTENFIL